MPTNPCIDDPYVEWAPLGVTEDTNAYWYGWAVAFDVCSQIVQYDITTYPPHPPSPPYVKPPGSPPPIGAPVPPRVRRPKAPALPY